MGFVMLSLFQRRKVKPGATTLATKITEPPGGLKHPQSAVALLSAPRRQRLLEHIWQRTSLSHQQFGWLYQAPLERYAELVQLLPASESHHHAYEGGLLDHGLEIVAYALKLRQSHLLPAGAPPEEQAAQSEAWTAAATYAALLHDIGKVAVDLHIEYSDSSLWHPWHGPLQQPYRFRYREDRQYRLHSAATGLLYHQLLDRRILDWLSGYPIAWSALLYTLAGQYEHAGILGELVLMADQASVAQSLGGNPTKALAAPRHALQRNLLEGLRYLLRNQFKLNQPQASDGWLTSDSLWLVSKTVSDKLRAHLLSQGIEGIPSSNSAVFNVLQEHGMLQPTPDSKAIWRARVTSIAGWSHEFTLLRLSPAIIWENDKRPAAFEGSVEPLPEDIGSVTGQPECTSQADKSSASAPSSIGNSANTEPVAPNAMEELLTLFNSPEEESSPSQQVSAQPTSPDGASELPSSTQAPTGSATNDSLTIGSGEHFMAWLKQGLLSHKLIINDAKALVHTVADTLYLVSPGLFQRYAQEHPQINPRARQDKMQDWAWMQRRFEKLKFHRKQPSGLNIWSCTVTGPRKTRRLHGYLLEEPIQVFSDIPANNPYLKLINQINMKISNEK